MEGWRVRRTKFKTKREEWRDVKRQTDRHTETESDLLHCL